jgi:hypothetical protein
MKTKKHKKKHNKTSKRVLKMWKDPTSVWGKNKPLENFWRLLTDKYVILIYKDGKHKYINLPNRKTQKYKKLFDDFDNDNNIVAVLSSSSSQDAYELGLYPKAKDKSVDFVIKNYKKYFKPITIPNNISDDDPKMNKIWVF